MSGGVRRHPALVALHYGTLILLAIVCVAPIILMFATSLKLQTQIFNTGINFIFAPRWKTTATCWARTASSATSATA